MMMVVMEMEKSKLMINFSECDIMVMLRKRLMANTIATAVKIMAILTTTMA